VGDIKRGVKNNRKLAEEIGKLSIKIPPQIPPLERGEVRGLF
jgi:hypothetical protein